MWVAARPAVASPWAWHPHPDVWTLVAALVLVYFLTARRPGPHLTAEGVQPATARQTLLFLSGVATLWLGADWPMHDLSEGYLFSAHMVQHLLFTFVSPPLIVMGLPSWMLEELLRPRLVGRVVAFLTRPLVALLVFNLVIAVTHWPTLVNLSLRSEAAHFGIHTLLFVTATFMWWPVVDPLGRGSLSVPAKMLYLFGQSVLPTVPASFLTFAASPIYDGYVGVPRVWSAFDVVTDQRVAGLIMKLGGGLLLWTVIAVLFFRWNAAEEHREEELITWDDFERELEVWDLRR